MTIQRKFILAILLMVVVPTAVFGYVAIWFSREQLSQFIYDRIASVNTLKAQRVENYLSTYRQNALSLSQNRTVQDAFGAIAKSELPSTAFNEIVSETRQENGLDDIKLLTPNNKVVYVSRQKNKDQVGNTAEGLLLDTARASASGISYSKPFHDSTGDDLADTTYDMYIGAPVKDKDNQTLGIVIIEADLDMMYEIIADASGLSSTGETVLAVNDGYSALVLTPLRYDQGAALTRRISFGDTNETGIQQAVRGESGKGAIIDYRGIQAMAAWQSLPDVNWGILTKIDTTEAMSVITNLKKFTIIGAVAWLLFVFMVFLLFIRAVLTKPIRHLADVAQQLADGLDADRIDHALLYRNDEMGTIATALHNLRRTAQHGPSEASKDNPDAKLTPHVPDHYHGGHGRD
jgi:HAMP domain-containing protein